MPTTACSRAIGIDVGGTRVRAAVVDSAGHVLARCDRSNVRGDSAGQFIEWVVDALAKLRDETGADCDTSMSVGLALPGVLDSARGALKRSVNLPYLDGHPLGKMLADRTGFDCVLVTDAEAATWGEYTVRLPRPERFVHLRLGTGVACGVVLNGQLQRLDQDRVTHLEILIIDRTSEAIPCPCGLAGCLETIASGIALAARAKDVGLANGLTGLAEGWQRGDPRALRIVEKGAEAIRIALRNLATQFQPHVVSIGGGVVARLPCLLELATAVPSDAFEPTHAERAFIVESARLGDDAGVIGAGVLALKFA